LINRSKSSLSFPYLFFPSTKNDFVSFPSCARCCAVAVCAFGFLCCLLSSLRSTKALGATHTHTHTRTHAGSGTSCLNECVLAARTAPYSCRGRELLEAHGDWRLRCLLA
jgi:hypothetical protein